MAKVRGVWSLPLSTRSVRFSAAMAGARSIGRRSRFHHLATEGPGARAAVGGSFARSWRCLRRRCGALGYNAASLDDVAHLSLHPWFEPEVRARHASVLPRKGGANAMFCC